MPARLPQMSSDEIGEHAFDSAVAAEVMFLARARFEETPVLELPLTSTCYDSGVYALYYVGPFSLYTQLVAWNRAGHEVPIYVGKTVPAGSRTGTSDTAAATGSVCARVNQHARNVESAPNLQVSGFRCRFMVVAPALAGMIPAIETALINAYHPVWNSVVAGFGNHDPGNGRYAQARSDWDALHPGRPWVNKLTSLPPPNQEATGTQRVLDALNHLSSTPQ